MACKTLILIFQITSLIISICASVTYLESSAISGQSTYYEGNPSGNACGYASVSTATFPFGYYAACGGTVFDSGYGCGKCYEITCIGPTDPSNTGCSCSTITPSVIISCMDECTECSSTYFKLNATAMARIIGPGLSETCNMMKTSIQRVACEYTTNIKIRVKSKWIAGIAGFGLHIDNIAGYGTVSTVQIKSFNSNSSSYDTTCDKSQGPSFWVCSGGILITPLTVKLTNDNYEVVVFVNCITNLNNGATFDCGSNFDGGVPSPTTEPTASPTPIPTQLVTIKPSLSPETSSSSLPTPSPTAIPTPSPTIKPTPIPTLKPSVDTTTDPTIYISTGRPTWNPITIICGGNYHMDHCGKCRLISDAAWNDCLRTTTTTTTKLPTAMPIRSGRAITDEPTCKPTNQLETTVSNQENEYEDKIDGISLIMILFIVIGILLFLLFLCCLYIVFVKYQKKKNKVNMDYIENMQINMEIEGEGEDMVVVGEQDLEERNEGNIIALAQTNRD